MRRGRPGRGGVGEAAPGEVGGVGPDPVLDRGLGARGGVVGASERGRGGDRMRAPSAGALGVAALGGRGRDVRGEEWGFVG